MRHLEHNVAVTLAKLEAKEAEMNLLATRYRALETILENSGNDVGKENEAEENASKNRQVIDLLDARNMRERKRVLELENQLQLQRKIAEEAESKVRSMEVLLESQKAEFGAAKTQVERIMREAEVREVALIQKCADDLRLAEERGLALVEQRTSDLKRLVGAQAHVIRHGDTEVAQVDAEVVKVHMALTDRDMELADLNKRYLGSIEHLQSREAVSSGGIGGFFGTDLPQPDVHGSHRLTGARTPDTQH